MTRAGLLTLASAALLLGGAPGVRPRTDATDYPARATGAGATIGAAIIPPGEVKKIFATDLNRGGYVVIEVGVYPEPDKDVDLSPADFTLSADPRSAALRPVDAAAAAAAIERVHETPDPTEIHGTTGAAVAIGNDPYDPLTGRRVTGTTTRTGIGVGSTPQPNPFPGTNNPAPAPDPRQTGPRPAEMEQELWAKSLPDGITKTPVAGYLYFPKPSGKTKNNPWELIWDGPAGRVKVTVQSPARK